MTFFKVTTADEKGGRGGRVGAILRAATHLTREFTATERGDHLQARIFIEAIHAPSRGATYDENPLRRRGAGGGLIRS